MTPLSRIAPAEPLIAAARDGDRAAQAALYAELAPATLRLIARLVPAHAAEDVFQDVMMAAFERLGDWRGPAPLGAWLRGIAVNRSLSYLRSPWHRLRDWLGGSIEEVADAVQAQLPGGADAPATDADLARLLARLPPVARVVLWLHEVEGYSHAEIAAATGRTVSYSKSIVSRAHRELRAQAASIAPADAVAGARRSVP